MDFEKITQVMTKEEFLNDRKLTNRSGCPNNYGLKNVKSCGDVPCKDCWKQAIEKGNVKFKSDKSKEQNVIDALNVIRNYCRKKVCEKCDFGGNNNCTISKFLGDSWSPVGWEIEEIENSIKSKIVIYKVEHSKNGKRYTFISDEDLPVGTIVICNTKYGQTYGKIVDKFKGVDDGNKKCWRAE